MPSSTFKRPGLADAMHDIFALLSDTAAHFRELGIEPDGADVVETAGMIVRRAEADAEAGNEERRTKTLERAAELLAEMESRTRPREGRA